jgi:cyclophilin family peptidyl-prolyl cis-trans isomerase
MHPCMSNSVWNSAAAADVYGLAMRSAALWTVLACASSQGIATLLQQVGEPSAEASKASTSPPALEPYRVRLETTKGALVMEVVPRWAPRAAERFRELVRIGYYDDTRFFRVTARWAQFGISGNPALAQKWRDATLADEDSAGPTSNLRGTVAFAFAVPHGRSTQVFISLTDNRRLDAEAFVPFGRVVEGMNVADSLYAGYGESSGGGIRGGKQGPLFLGGNEWLDAHFPLLDSLLRARILR